MARIAVLAHSHHPIRQPFAGGLETHTYLLCDQLVAAGHEVVLFAKAGSDDRRWSVQPIVPENLKFYAYPRNSLESRRQATRMRQAYQRAHRQIDDQNFDFVINNSLSPVNLEWVTETPVLSVFHTPVLPDLITPAREASLHSNRLFVAVSPTCAAEWRTCVPQTGVVPNGIDVAAWSTSVKPTDELRWSARITPEKGLHLAIDAARMTGRTLRIAGPVSDVEYFDHEIRPRLGHDVVHEGHLHHDDLPDFLGSGAVALATPMWEEPFGLSVIEALACGTPVAALPMGAMRDLVHSGVGAVSVDSTAAAYAVAIESAAGVDRAACRAYVEAEFDVQVMVERYLAPLTTLRPTASVDGATCVAG